MFSAEALKCHEILEKEVQLLKWAHAYFACGFLVCFKSSVTQKKKQNNNSYMNVEIFFFLYLMIKSLLVLLHLMLSPFFFFYAFCNFADTGLCCCSRRWCGFFFFFFAARSTAMWSQMGRYWGEEWGIPVWVANWLQPASCRDYRCSRGATWKHCVGPCGAFQHILQESGKNRKRGQKENTEAKST